MVEDLRIAGSQMYKMSSVGQGTKKTGSFTPTSRSQSMFESSY